MANLRRFSASLLAALLLPALALAAEILIGGCVAVPGGRPASVAQAQLRPILSMYEDGALAFAPERLGSGSPRRSYRGGRLSRSPQFVSLPAEGHPE